MRRRLLKFFGIFLLTTICLLYISTRENSFQKAAQINLTGNANLKFAKTSYNIFFKKLSLLDEAVVESELKKIHQITEKISSTSISNAGDIMITLAKSMDNSVVFVVFKNQQIQMIQKVLKLSENKIEFQYGEITFSQESGQLAYSQNVELEF